MIWLLDTNVLIHAVRGTPPSVRRRLRAESPDDLAISSVTVAELFYGIRKSTNPPRKMQAWMHVLAPYEVLPFDRAAAEKHAEVRWQLRSRPIGDRDLIIAAIALTHDLTVVSHNLREFGRIPGLRVEDWAGS